MSNPGNSILQRITKYCADAERSTHDALSKLISWGVPPDETEIILAKLRTEKFLDDQRFAKSYVTEKWNLDKWGRLKIENALQQKNIDPAIIHETLSIITEEEYLQGLNELLEKKYKEVKSNNPMDDARRIMMFALSRGFEEELIQEWLEKEEFDSR
ncbi:MAG: regulatory protein RecX [Saprospiraceae bacterium]